MVRSPDRAERRTHDAYECDLAEQKKGTAAWLGLDSESPWSSRKFALVAVSSGSQKPPNHSAASRRYGVRTD